MNLANIIILCIFVLNIIIGILIITTTKKEKSGWFWGILGWFWGILGWFCATMCLLIGAGVLK